ncbi:multiheme c-type cytochrome [Marinobacter sp. 1Y8]
MHSDTAHNNRGVDSVIATTLMATLWLLVSGSAFADTQNTLPEPSFVGGSHCAGCHQAEADNWKDSHHDLAMQVANPDTVEGDFDNAAFDYAGTRTTFSRSGDKFQVSTDGPDGKLATYDIRYTFGVYPLQQYLIELAGGRLQALNIAWDSRPAKEGGQRWYHLYPDQNITHTDPLHWTKPQQNWNFMCAECHSTGLEKNYDQASRTYDTQWAEIDVSCEACHGPGSNHVKWAEQGGEAEGGSEPASFKHYGLTHLFNERKGVHWSQNQTTGLPKRSAPRATETEIQVCAACHSRRAQLSEDDRKGQPLMDSYQPARLDAGLYHADGQIDGEVYVYGSFIQSAMYKAGVTCSDCHNPHSLELKAPDNGVCLQCHTPEYDSPEHHFHQTSGANSGSQCVDCHMPEKTYMGVDPRRDHSFRIPQPRLSADIGVPNACTNCHEDQSDKWAANQLTEWYGRDPSGTFDYARALSAARHNAPDAGSKLIALLDDITQPAIARSTAAKELAGWPNPQTLQSLAAATRDKDPLVRLGALEGIAPLPASIRIQVALPMLDDPVKAVRLEAVAQLSDISAQSLPPEQARQLREVANDYRATLTFAADTAQAHVNLGGFEAAQRRLAAAERAYQNAIETDPNYAPAYANLADFYRATDQDDKGLEVLQQGIKRQPEAGALHHALGLLYIRQKQLNNALDELALAVQYSPEVSRYSYVYAVGLNSTGKTDQAIKVTEQALLRSPGEPSLNQLIMQLRQSR